MFIGELAKKTGFSPKTIRFYEEIGLLPRPRRSESGYRLYPSEAVEYLRFVRIAQSLGLKLAEIKEIIAQRRDGPPCDYVGQLLREKIAWLDAEIARLQETRGQLTEVLAHWEETCCQPESQPLSVICPCIEMAGSLQSPPTA